MNLFEALCGAIESAGMDESPEGMAFAEAVASSGELSARINDDGSVSLKSGDASLDVPADAIAAEEAGEAEEPMMEGMAG